MKSQIKIQDKSRKIDNISLILMIMLNFVLTVVPPIIGLLWFNNLKKNKCACSNIKWYVNYIVFYFIFIICYSCISLLYLAFFRSNVNLYIISILLFIYNILSYIIIVFYINKLNNKKDCPCANSIKKDFIYIWYFIKLIFASILILIFIIGLTVAYFTNYKK